MAPEVSLNIVTMVIVIVTMDIVTMVLYGIVTMILWMAPEVSLNFQIHLLTFLFKMGECASQKDVLICILFCSNAVAFQIRLQKIIRKEIEYR